MGPRRLQIGLGLLWLLDGALQFQPFMFTKSFFAGVLGMANMGLPGPVATAVYPIAELVVAHPAVWNALFASLQVALGAGLLYRRTARVALIASVPWALGVWVIGEGFGGLFMGTSLLIGAPGAAVLYAVLAVLAWPSLGAPARDLVGRTAWCLTWAGSALLEFEVINHDASVPGAQIADGSPGEPAWLAWLDRTAGHALHGQGVGFAVALGVSGGLIGLGVWWRRSAPVAVIAGIVLAVGVGVIGQDLGNIATGQGTDPGTGPLLVLFALALWPILRSAGRDAPALISDQTTTSAIDGEWRRGPSGSAPTWARGASGAAPPL